MKLLITNEGVDVKNLDEKWRRYWMGKPSKSEKAVKYYLENFGRVHMSEPCEIYGVTVETIQRHVVNLRKIGLAPERHYGRIKSKQTGDAV